MLDTHIQGLGYGTLPTPYSSTGPIFLSLYIR